MTATYRVQRTISNPHAEYGPSNDDIRIAITWDYLNRVANGWSDQRLQVALETVAERLSAEHDEAVAAGTAPTSGDLRIVVRGGSETPVVLVGYWHAASHHGPSDDVLIDLGRRVFTAIDQVV